MSRRIAVILGGRSSENAAWAANTWNETSVNSDATVTSEIPGVTVEPIAGGGRYDTLLQALGAAKAIPAVGCAIFGERLLAARRAQGAA